MIDMENMEMINEVEVAVIDVDAVLANDKATVAEILEAKQELTKTIGEDLSRALKGQHAARKRIRKATLVEDKLNLKLRKAISVEKVAIKAARAEKVSTTVDATESLF